MNLDAGFERTEQTLTQNQLSELLETDQAKALVEGAEERGYVEPPSSRRSRSSSTSTTRTSRS